MNTFVKLFEDLKTSLFKKYSGDAGKMLLHTGTFAWITSATAQIFGIANSDKFSKREKSFLIPQEIVDSVINVVSFYVVTNSLQNMTKKWASSGKIISPAIKKFCNKAKINIFAPDGTSQIDIGKALLSKIDELKATYEKNIKEGIGSERLNKWLEGTIKKFDNFYDHEYAPFESGFKIIGNIAGAVISSNIIAPVLRNPIAAWKQKRAMQHHIEIHQQNKPLNPVSNQEQQPAKPQVTRNFNTFDKRLNLDDYKNKVSRNTLYTQNSSSLSI